MVALPFTPAGRRPDIPALEAAQKEILERQLLKSGKRGLLAQQAPLRMRQYGPVYRAPVRPRSKSKKRKTRSRK